MLRKIFGRRHVSPEESAYRRLKDRGYTPRSIVDVGAYEGNWTRLAKRYFPDAQVVMCEAQPGKARRLEAVAAEYPDVRLVCAVMAARSGETAAFSVMETGSSIFPENSNVPRTVCEIATKTLDEVTGGLEGPVFLKIDVQGAELEVLAGAPSLLAKCDLVQLEIALLEYNRGAPTFLEVIAWMDERGFVPFDLAGWSRPNGVDLVQIDLLFVMKDSPMRPSRFEF